MRNKRVIRIVLLGLMLALEIILSRFLSISTPIVKIGFAFVPVVIVGMLYGWPWSMAVAALGDFIGAILFPIGPYFPGYTFSAALSGAFMGIMLFDGGNNVTVWSPIKAHGWNKLLRCFIAAFSSLLICSLLLDTLWLYLTASAETVQGLLPARLIKFVVMLPVQTFVTYGLLSAKARLLPLASKN
ncbi:MAG: folate family ECF transporter S component [Clostridia bacterium]|nr:folate family ECF transporter S component [Clostridia bacterium]